MGPASAWPPSGCHPAHGQDPRPGTRATLRPLPPPGRGTQKELHRVVVNYESARNTFPALIGASADAGTPSPGFPRRSRAAGRAGATTARSPRSPRGQLEPAGGPQGGFCPGRRRPALSTGPQGLRGVALLLEEKGEGAPRAEQCGAPRGGADTSRAASRWAGTRWREPSGRGPWCIAPQGPCGPGHVNGTRYSINSR